MKPFCFTIYSLSTARVIQEEPTNFLSYVIHITQRVLPFARSTKHQSSERAREEDGLGIYLASRSRTKILIAQRR